MYVEKNVKIEIRSHSEPVGATNNSATAYGDMVKKVYKHFVAEKDRSGEISLRRRDKGVAA